MDIGLGIMSGSRASQVLDEVSKAAQDGFDSVWFSNIFGFDALTASALAGSSVPEVTIGTFVVPIYTRHPLTMAQQAMSVQDSCDGRFVLGIGLSHQVVIETMMGIDFSKPASTMREYVQAITPLLKEGSVSFNGDFYSVNAMLERPGGFVAPKIIIAALGSVMLKLAGSLADGTATWMTGINTLKTHIVPTIRNAAEQAGRESPMVVAGLPICVTSNEGQAREKAASIFSIYGTLPSYRAMLDREGANGPAEVSLVGTSSEVRTHLEDLAESGVTCFVAAPFGNEDEVKETKGVLMDFAKSQ